MASKLVLGAFVAGSLVFSSTAAGASAPQVQQADPWAVLTAMSGGAPAAAMCGAAAAAVAAAQSPGGCVLPVLDAPPPPPAPAAGPPPAAPLVPAASAAGIGISPLLISLVAIAAVVGVYLAVHNHGHGNSPA